MMSLAEEYNEAERREADVVYDFRQQKQTRRFSCIDVPLIAESSLAAKQGVEDAFVVAQVFTEDECSELIQLAENTGIVPPLKEAGTHRTAKRTDRYQNSDISSLIVSRIGNALRDRMSADSSFGEFHDLHDNWRILRYDPGDSFPAHQDQMDSFRKLDKQTGKAEMFVSSHTLLINLSQDGVEGGATRFYPRCKVAGKSMGQYEYAVDVVLPRGWALVFPQLGMVHAGQPVDGGNCKYVAQAGVLRRYPPANFLRPNVFRLGPGLQPV